MFNENDIEKYRSIAPPKALKERVMATYDNGTKRKPQIKLYKQISLIAACVVLVIVSSVVVKTGVGKIDLFADNSRVSEMSVTFNENGVQMASERTVINDSVDFRIKTFIKSEISVSQGKLSLCDEKTGEVIASGNPCSVKGDVCIRWSPESGSEETAEIKISNIFSEETYKLCYDSETGIRTIQKIN